MEIGNAEIYGIFDNRDNSVFYVGVTKYSCVDRFSVHMAQVETDTHTNKHFANKVRKIGAENVCVKIIKRVPVARRWDEEENCIKELTANGHVLTNRIHNGLVYDTREPVDIVGNEKKMRAFLDAPHQQHKDQNVNTAILLLRDYISEVLLTCEKLKAAYNGAA